MTDWWMDDREVLGFIGSPSKSPALPKTERTDIRELDLGVDGCGWGEKCLWKPNQQSKNVVAQALGSPSRVEEKMDTALGPGTTGSHRTRPGPMCYSRA